MNTIIKLLILTAVLLVTSEADAAELMLREQATRHGSIIRLADVADISAATSAEVEVLASTPLLPAPAPGTVQYLTVARLRDLLVARGINVDQLSIKGSLLVELGEALPRDEPTLTVKRTPTSQVDAELLVEQAIDQVLQQASTIGRWRVDVQLTQSQRKQLDSLGSDITAHAMQPLRAGRIRFQIRSIDGTSTELKIVADITKIQSVVVTKQSIARGQLVRAIDVEIREREGNLPSGTLDDLQLAIGKVALRSFKPDEVVQQNYLRAAWQVRRGETVNAFVRTGNITVRTRAIAKQNGAMGDLIAVETLADKQRLDVTVSGPSEVTVYATGGRATDYATLDRGETLRR